MKKLKDITQTKSLKGAGDAYVPDEPIHFKMGHDIKPYKNTSDVSSNSSDDAYVPDEPVHFKHVSKLKEESEHKKDIHSWFDHNQNKHIGHSSHEISNALEHHLTKNHPLTHHEEHHAKKYTSTSSDLNANLIAAHKTKHDVHPHKIDPYHHQTIHHLDTATKRPIGHHVHLYSGLGFNPAHMKNKNGHVHLPAYTSMTHDKRKADGFAYDKSYRHEGDKHILHLHMKKSDKGVHVSHISHYSSEHETILPRNTRIKIHKKPAVYSHDDGTKTHVWHAHIVHQD